jgi:hypothetical protein
VHRPRAKGVAPASSGRTLTFRPQKVSAHFLSSALGRRNCSAASFGTVNRVADFGEVALERLDPRSVGRMVRKKLEELLLVSVNRVRNFMAKCSRQLLGVLHEIQQRVHDIDVTARRREGVWLGLVYQEEFERMGIP